MKTYMLVLLIVAVGLMNNGCALKELLDTASSSSDTSAPKWDMKFDVPVVNKTIDMSDYFDVPSIVSTTITPFTLSSVKWPMPQLPAIDPAEVNAPMSIDFDGDGAADFSMTSLASSTGYMQLKVDLQLNGITTQITKDDISISGITIEGTSYSFGTPIQSGNSLIFKTTGFLDYDGAEIRPDTVAPDDTLDIDLQSVVVGDASLAVGTGNDVDVTISLTPTFYFGEDFAVTGELASDTTLFSIDGQEIALTESLMVIDNFSIKIETTNYLPLSIELQNAYFKATDATTIDLVDENGDPINIPLGENTTYATTTSSIFNKGTMDLYLDMVLPANTDIVLRNKMYITFKLSLAGEGTLDFQYF